MRKNIIEIRLLSSKVTNALPTIMRDLSGFDLIYREGKTQECDSGIEINLVCRAMTDIDERLLKQFLESMPIVNEVISIFQSKIVSNEAVKSSGGFKPHAKDEITHDVLHFAETRLSESYGPVASLILRSAARKSNNVGSLFLNLARGLDEKKRCRLLEDIQGLDEIE